MVFVVIILVGEAEDRLFENVILEPQISRVDLVKEIESVTNIPPKFQQIQFRGDKLPNSLHPLESINDFEELVVKHALLGKWSQYLEYCKNGNDKKNARPERTKFAHHAIACSKMLDDSGFFTVYGTFGAQWIETLSPMMRWYSGWIVVAVTCHDEEANYYMKTYHHAGSSNSLQNTAKRHLPDLREMFAYRLLELIGVGPVVFFPFDAASTYIHYIATKEVKEFKELDKLEDVSLQNKVVVEAYLLSLILGIRDLHEGNIGSTEEKALTIIDFYVPDTDNFLRRRILDDFKDKSNFGGLGKANEILTEIGHEERMKIAKDALPHWSRINSMTSDIIGIEKSELGEHGIKLGTATNDVESYLQDIKLNYVSICLAFQ